MDPLSDLRSVTILENGRSGQVLYREPAGELSFYWEFGGSDVVAIVHTGTSAEWRTKPAWAADRMDEIKRFVAAEVVRQRAPTGRAEIHEASGDILVRQVATTPPPSASADVAWYGRWRKLRTKLALGVLALALMLGGLVWFKKNVLVIDPGKGTLFGSCVRTDAHIATLIQTLEPYTPSLNRDHGKDRYAISIFIVPLDGSEPRLIPLAGDLPPNEFALAKVLGGDGRSLWYDVNGVGTIDLSSFEARPGGGPAPRDLQGALASPIPPAPDAFLSAGFIAGPGTWIGLHSAEEVERDFRPDQFVRSVVRQESVKQMRRFHHGALDAPVDDKYYRILSISPITDTEYLNAAFLRMDDKSAPVRLTSPDGALMIYTSAPGLKGTLMVARVDTAGAIVWKVDTGIDRFKLQQILPGEGSLAFVGTRPPVPDKVSEPLLVIVENATGRMATHSLWQ